MKRSLLRPVCFLGLLLLFAYGVHLATAQGAAGLDGLARGAQLCPDKELVKTNDFMESASRASGKGGGSGGRGSPMVPGSLAAKFISHPAQPFEASSGRKLHLVQGSSASSDRKLHQGPGSSANRDVDPEAPFDGCQPSDLQTDRALHSIIAAIAYQGAVPWVRDQKDHATCVSHAFTAGIEASVATSLRIHPRDLPFNLSATYPHYCGSYTGPRGPKDVMFIGQFAHNVDNSSNFRPCLQMSDVPEFVQVRDACEAAERLCAADAAPGPRCALLKAQNQADVQRQIRTFGGVVTPLDIPNSTAFKQFFEQYPTGIWNDTSSCAGNASECNPYNHAVLIIGYNNTEGTYTVLNSWGTSFANGGTFKIRQGVGFVGLPSESYAMACIPGAAEDGEAIPTRTARVVPLPDEPGCYNHTVNTSNTPDLSVLATLLDISIGGILLNNTPAPIPLTNVTYVGSAAAGECPSGPTCGSNQTSPICVLEVTHDQLTGNCTVKAQVPEEVNLEGLTLKVCIPGSTFREYRTAVPVCPAGQQPTLSGSCETCPPHTYKNTTGPQKCTACPHKSYQPKSGSTACLPCPSQVGMAALLPADRAVVEQGCIKRDVSPKPGKPEVGTVQPGDTGSKDAASEGGVPSWGAQQRQQDILAIIALIILGFAVVVLLVVVAAPVGICRRHTVRNGH